MLKTEQDLKAGQVHRNFSFHATGISFQENQLSHRNCVVSAMLPIPEGCSLKQKTGSALIHRQCDDHLRPLPLL